jgi:hypothetical protein
MTSHVSDFGSNVNENLEHWAKTLGHSKLRRKVFNCVYGSQKRRWTAAELMERTRLTRFAVLHEGKKLAANGLLKELRDSGRVTYEKDSRIQHHKRAIIRYADSSKARNALPTKRRPTTTRATTVRVSVSSRRARAKQITIDDVESFRKAHRVSPNRSISRAISEARFRDGIKAILGELGHFADWGGEQNDLYSSNVRIEGKRVPTAFAFKGPGTKGILTPAKCGKNGDQIQRLMESPARAFFFQYHGDIGQNVIAQMRTHAMLHSIHTRQEVMYGVINGQDSERLVIAYPEAFV